MRYAIVIAAALGAFTATANAAGSEGKWCLNTFSTGAAVNCSFESQAQCMSSKTANADSCSPNPRASTGSSTHQKK